MTRPPPRTQLFAGVLDYRLVREGSIDETPATTHTATITRALAITLAPAAMLPLLPLTPATISDDADCSRARAEDLLDQAEILLLRRNEPTSPGLQALMAVFAALAHEARRLGDARVEALASSSHRLLALILAQQTGLQHDTENLLLDAVDRIQALLRRQISADHDLSRSLERRIVTLSA